MTTLDQTQNTAEQPGEQFTILCHKPTMEDVLAMDRDQRDAHTNLARWRETERQERAYRAVRDLLGIPYGIEYNPLMPPIQDTPEVTLFGGRRGSGKSNTMAFWTSFYKVRGYDPLTNMTMLNSYLLDDATDVYSLAYLWHNTPVFLGEMQFVSSTFEGPAHKTRMLLEFYSQLRKLLIPVFMDSAQPHRVYGQIDTELTWYAKPVKARHRPRRHNIFAAAQKRYAEFTHINVKYYGPFPVRYPDIAEKIFDDTEDEDPPERWKLGPDEGLTSEALWRASKIGISWETMTVGALLSVSAQDIRDKLAGSSASISVSDPARQHRLAICMQVVHMLFIGYLNLQDRQWTKRHILARMYQFAQEKPYKDNHPDYNYIEPSPQELDDALELEMNIGRLKTRITIQEIVRAFPQYFTQQEDQDDQI